MVSSDLMWRPEAGVFNRLPSIVVPLRFNTNGRSMMGRGLTNRIVWDSDVISPTPVEACASWMEALRVHTSVRPSTSFAPHCPSPSLTSSSSSSESTIKDLVVWPDGWRRKGDSGCSLAWTKLIDSP